jgi:hypothetical protein
MVEKNMKVDSMTTDGIIVLPFVSYRSEQRGYIDVSQKMDLVD